MDPNGEGDSTLVFEKKMLDAVYEKVSPYVVAVLFEPMITGFIAKTSSTHNLIAVETNLLGYVPDTNKMRVRYSDGVIAKVDHIKQLPGDIAVLYTAHHGKPRPSIVFGELEEKECQKIVTLFPYKTDLLFFKGHITLTDCTSESRNGFVIPGSGDSFMLTCPFAATYDLDPRVKREERAKFFRTITGAAVFDFQGRVVGRLYACGTAHTIKYATKCTVFSSYFDSPGLLDWQGMEKKEKNCKANDLSSSNEVELVPAVKKAKKKKEKKGKTEAEEDKMKASASVRHLVVSCRRAAWAQIIRPIIQCHSHGGPTLICTETTVSASELSDLIPGSRALDGHKTWIQRETVAEFRSGKFFVLVATNAASRELDINDVRLIIQCEPPRDVEAYIERSGRTGRAGNASVAVMLLEPGDESSVATIEKEFGVKFEHVYDVVESAGSEAAVAIASVCESTIHDFRQQAHKLLGSSGMSDVDLVAKALAKEVGYIVTEKRSLLSSRENYTTLYLRTDRPMRRPEDALPILRRFMPHSKVSDVHGNILTAGGAGAVFDVPSGDVEYYIQGAGNATGVKLEELKQLPALQEGEQSGGNSSGWKFGSEAADAIASLSDSVVPVFRQQAEMLLRSSSAVNLLAKALAKTVGYTDHKRSLLSSMANCTALHFKTAGSTICTPLYVRSTLKRFLPEDKLPNVQGIALTADGRGAVFDVPSAEVQNYLQGAENAVGVTLEKVKELPALQERGQQSRGGGGGGRGVLGRGGGGRFGAV